MELWAHLYSINETPPALPKDVLGAGTAVLAGFALDREDELLVSLKLVVGQSPFRNMIRPGGSACLSPCQTVAHSAG
jgi:hypothetical protein